MNSPICANCRVSMYSTARPEGSNLVRYFFVCPRCRATIDDRVEPGQMEIDEPWFLEVFIPERLSAQQLKAIRSAHDSTSRTSLEALRKTLRPSTLLRLGPYTREAASETKSKLDAAGLRTKLGA